MKTLNLILSLSFLLFLIGVKGQQQCDEFGGLTSASYNVGDLMYTAPFFQVKADNFFAGSTCGGGGASWQSLSSNVGFSLAGNISCLFDCSNQVVTYKISTENDQCFTVRVNGQICADYSGFSGISNLQSSAGNIAVEFDTVSNELKFTGEVCEIEIGADFAKIETICIEPNSNQNCQAFGPDGIYLGVGDTTFVFNGNNQKVSLEVYGFFYDQFNGQATHWDLTSNHQAHQTLFKVNGATAISLETIYNSQPYFLNGVSITVDTNSLNYSGGGTNWASGTVIFTGNIQNVTMVQFESGLLNLCVEPIENGETICMNNASLYYESLNQTIPQVGDTLAIYSGLTHVANGGNAYVVNSSGVNYVETLGQSKLIFDDCTSKEVKFSLEGLQHVKLRINTTGNSSLSNFNYTSLSTSDYIEVSTNDVSYNYDSNTKTLTFIGDICSIDIEESDWFRFNSICITPIETCEIFADYSSSITGLTGSFIGLGNGNSHTWDFGNGITSNEVNPIVDFDTPGTYEVCYTSSEGNCMETFCQNIEVAAMSNENILTPNGDGYDDTFLLNCNDVHIYDRNGTLINIIGGQTNWDGKDSNGVLVPMGLYVIECLITGGITNVTVIR